MKKILIVGGTGFLGFHFAKYCLKKNLVVLSLSRHKAKKIRSLKKVNYIFADILKKKLLFNRLKKHTNINYVINFGGEVDHKKKRKTFDTHYKGLKNLTEYFVRKNLLKFIQIGSSLEYGNAKSPQNEKNALKPNSFYSKAKALSSEFLFKKFKSNQFPATIVRPYQVYGPYQDINRLIPIVIQNCLKNNFFPCSGGNQLRDFLFVDDFVKILFKLMKSKSAIGKSFNIGSGRPLRIKKIIFEIKKIVKMGKPIFNKISLRKDENIVTYPNISKISKITKIKPKITFKKGLLKTIKFYQNNII